VPTAYGMCRAYGGMERRKNKNKEMKNIKM
jgi:hypothetical protein